MVVMRILEAIARGIVTFYIILCSSALGSILSCIAAATFARAQRGAFELTDGIAIGGLGGMLGALIGEHAATAIIFADVSAPLESHDYSGVVLFGALIGVSVGAAIGFGTTWYAVRAEGAARADRRVQFGAHFRRARKT